MITDCTSLWHKSLRLKCWNVDISRVRCCNVEIAKTELLSRLIRLSEIFSTFHMPKWWCGGEKGRSPTDLYTAIRLDRKKLGQPNSINLFKLYQTVHLYLFIFKRDLYCSSGRKSGGVIYNCVGIFYSGHESRRGELYLNTWVVMLFIVTYICTPCRSWFIITLYLIIVVWEHLQSNLSWRREESECLYLGNTYCTS